MYKKICMVYGIKISFSKWLTKTNICNSRSDPRENLLSDDDLDLGKSPDRVDITFSEIIFPHTIIIVCDITPDVIIGQDFLLKYVKKFDYQKLVLQTEQTAIQCWIAGEAAMICRVEVSEKTTIPANSRMFIPVEIPCCEKLSANCVGEPSIHIFQEKTIAIMSCLLHNSGSVKYVSVHNVGDIDAVIHQKHKIGCL